MANIYDEDNYDYNSANEGLTQKQRIAQLLMNNTGKGQMIDGWYVAPNGGGWGQVASSLGQVLGGYLQGKNTKAEAELNKKDRAVRMEGYNDVFNPNKEQLLAGYNPNINANFGATEMSAPQMPQAQTFPVGAAPGGQPQPTALPTTDLYNPVEALPENVMAPDEAYFKQQNAARGMYLKDAVAAKRQEGMAKIGSTKGGDALLDKIAMAKFERELEGPGKEQLHTVGNKLIAADGSVRYDGGDKEAATKTFSVRNRDGSTTEWALNPDGTSRKLAAGDTTGGDDTDPGKKIKQVIDTPSNGIMVVYENGTMAPATQVGGTGAEAGVVTKQQAAAAKAQNTKEASATAGLSQSSDALAALTDLITADPKSGKTPLEIAGSGYGRLSNLVTQKSGGVIPSEGSDMTSRIQEGGAKVLSGMIAELQAQGASPTQLLNTETEAKRQLEGRYSLDPKTQSASEMTKRANGAIAYLKGLQANQLKILQQSKTAPAAAGKPPGYKQTYKGPDFPEY